MVNARQCVEHPAMLRHGGIQAQTEVDLAGQDLQVARKRPVGGNDVGDSLSSDEVSPLWGYDPRYLQDQT